MTDPVDNGLAKLRRARSDRNLDGLEASVFARIDASQQDVFRGHGLQVQLAVSCGALLIGLAVAQAMGGGEGIRSEAVVLSDDSGLAPSISLEGGA